MGKDHHHSNIRLKILWILVPRRSAQDIIDFIESTGYIISEIAKKVHSCNIYDQKKRKSANARDVSLRNILKFENYLLNARKMMKSSDYVTISINSSSQQITKANAE